MSVTAQAIAHRSRASLRLVFWASLAYLIVAAFQLLTAVLKLVNELQNRSSGIPREFAVHQNLPQPTGWSYSGAPYVVPGTTMTLTRASATVANLPVASIAQQGAAEIIAILTGAAIVACIMLLVAWITQGKPFAAAAARTLVVLACVVMVGFESQSVLQFMADQPLGNVMFGGADVQDGFSVYTANTTIISFTPIYIGLALLGLAAAFRVGASLEKETEGLV